MRKYLVQVAVAAAIATAASMAANAASYTIHISGASAQRTFWEEDLSQLTQGTFAAIPNGTCVFNAKTTAALNPAVPDLHTATCTVTAGHGAHLPTGILVNDTITLEYEAEFGSVWGIAPFIPGSTASTRGRASATCNGVTGYSRDLDTATACLSAPTPIDIGVSDTEPTFWALPDNWSYSDGVTSNGVNGTGTNGVINVLSIPGQGQPTLAQLQALEQTWQEVNGEVFSVVVNNTAAPTNAITNLSTQSLRSIFTGQYTTWSQVPELAGVTGNGANIVVCRRDHGSGTQVSSSLYFTQTECGGNNGTSATGSATGGTNRFVSTPQSAAGAHPGSLSTAGLAVFESTFANNPVENFSTNDITACLNAYPGQTIGIRSLAPASGYTTLNIDNVQANAHNAALGIYKFAVTTYAFNNTANSQPTNAGAQSIASQLILDAQTGSNGALPTEPGTMTNGAWTSTAPSVVYGITDGGLNPKPSIAAITANPSFPIQVWKSNAGSQCTIAVNNFSRP
jgi:ABC-type phosphate transport system substrate-binding protein